MKGEGRLLISSMAEFKALPQLSMRIYAEKRQF